MYSFLLLCLSFSLLFVFHSLFPSLLIAFSLPLYLSLQLYINETEKEKRRQDQLLLYQLYHTSSRPFFSHPRPIFPPFFNIHCPPSLNEHVIRHERHLRHALRQRFNPYVHGSLIDPFRGHFGNDPFGPYFPFYDH